MGWFFKKKKIGQQGEISVLERKEQKVTRKEIKLCEEAINCFHFVKSQWNVDGSIMVKKIDETQKKLLDLNIYFNKMVALAKRLEADLLDMREGTKDARVNYLSSSELQILDFAKSIKKQIEYLISKLQELHNYGSKGKHEDVSRFIDLMTLELNGLHKLLVNLFELELKVEELTKEYVNT